VLLHHERELRVGSPTRGGRGHGREPPTSAARTEFADEARGLLPWLRVDQAAHVHLVEAAAKIGERHPEGAIAWLAAELRRHGG
jgi:hypothetical protein